MLVFSYQRSLNVIYSANSLAICYNVRY